MVPSVREGDASTALQGAQTSHLRAPSPAGGSCTAALQPGWGRHIVRIVPPADSSPAQPVPASSGTAALGFGMGRREKEARRREQAVLLAGEPRLLKIVFS